MNSVVLVLAICMAGALAAPEGLIKFIPILERTEHHEPAGNFQLHYVTGDGITVNEQGILRTTLDGKDKVLIKEGDFVYTAPDGQVIRTKYVADHLGFRAVGDHLPKSVVAIH